jgi:NADH-quinone oxidoreductase subunit L
MIGTLAISGIPPLAGFFSKDEILAKVFMQNQVLFYVLAISSVLTAIYMFRLLFLTFYGSFRGSHEQEHHLHESPAVMTWPLIILAALSAIGGFIGIPELFSETHVLNQYLAPILSVPGSLNLGSVSHTFEWILLGASVVILTLIILKSYRQYVSGNNIPSLRDEDIKGFGKILYNKYYIDEIYRAIIVRPLIGIGNICWNYFDKKIIDGFLRSLNKGVILGSQGARLIQTGNIGFYIFAMVFGIIAILMFNLLL